MRGLVSDVSPRTGSHVVCYCDDCQAFGRWLGSPGLLDRFGGTEVYQVAPSQVAITQGMDALRCVRLSEKGLYRWYAHCCRTHVGNALSARVPFIGLSRSFMELSDDDAEALLGKAVAIQGRFAVGGVPPGVHARAPLSLIARTVRLLLGWRLAGKGKPSPIFDAQTGAPRVTPQVLAPDVRAALYTS